MIADEPTVEHCFNEIASNDTEKKPWKYVLNQESFLSFRHLENENGSVAYFCYLGGEGPGYERK